MTEYRYEIDIYWSDSDHAYVAEVPELPGCAADGPTYGGALSAAEKAITVWIETAQSLGRAVPNPRQRQVHR